MSITQKITYTNRTQGKLLIILEPWAEEYWIEPDQPVDIEVYNGSPGGHLEIEHTPEGLIVYGWEGTLVSNGPQWKGSSAKPPKLRLAHKANGRAEPT